MDDKLKFPCVMRNSKYVTTDDCIKCKNNKSCDIYPLMLDEEYERKNEGS